MDIILREIDIRKCLYVNHLIKLYNLLETRNIIFRIIIKEGDIKALRMACTCHKILIRVPQKRRFKIWTNVLDAFL